MDRLYLILAVWQDRAAAWWHATRRALRSLWRCHGRHANDLVIEPGRIFLSCSTCGRRTAGWDCRLTTGRN